jgi:hypothetical protein
VRGRFGSMEREVLLDVFDVGGGNEGGLPQAAFALAVFALQQVARTLFATEDLTRASDFETLGDGFPCLCFSRDSWHGAANLGAAAPVARQKWLEFFPPVRRLQGGVGVDWVISTADPPAEGTSTRTSRASAAG